MAIVSGACPPLALPPRPPPPQFPPPDSSRAGGQGRVATLWQLAAAAEAAEVAAATAQAADGTARHQMAAAPAVVSLSWADHGGCHRHDAGLPPCTPAWPRPHGGGWRACREQGGTRFAYQWKRRRPAAGRGSEVSRPWTPRRKAWRGHVQRPKCGRKPQRGAASTGLRRPL